MANLEFQAGSSALKKLNEQGCTPDKFTAFLGASGGPKWFVLCGLDKVVFNEFLHNQDEHIDIIGSSVGAFRASCFAQRDPAKAIARLADRYSNTVYTEKPDVEEITEKGIDVLEHMVGSMGVSEILSCVKKTVHIVVARCHGMVASKDKKKLIAGLALAATRNVVSRSKLQKSFTRAILSSNDQALEFQEQVPIRTEYAELSEDNFLHALMASGSIPAVIKGVENISGLRPGMFRDGGIIDYHFDMQIKTPGLVLYPHFYTKVTPGWFDKGLKSRVCHPSSYSNVLMVSPSTEFVHRLPYSKIPDRKDFETMDAQQRIQYWQRVMSESERLAEEFLNNVHNKHPSEYIKPINLVR